MSCVSPEGQTLQPFKAKKIVVTWPLGVWKAQADHLAHVEWQPALPAWVGKTLDSLEMGHVQKLIFRFRNRFWEELHKKPIRFMHLSNENYFPTWWTLMPHRTPHLIARQGGPRALEMSRWSRDKKIKTALQTLQKLTGKSSRFLNGQMEICHTHDWSNDPFCLGSYSYVKNSRVNQNNFSKSVDNTVYFGGELTLDGANRGTVGGAIESGLRAAKYVKNDITNAVRSRVLVQPSV